MYVSRQIFVAVSLLPLFCCHTALAQDIIVEGKHCNTMCQSWLGIRPTSLAEKVPVVVSLKKVPPSNVKQVESRKTIIPKFASEQHSEVRQVGSYSPTPVESDFDQRSPNANEGAEAPDISKLVAVRGVVMVESATEKKFSRQQRAALIIETTKRDVGIGDVRGGP